LASSIHLVCRPREHADGRLVTDTVGDWREILGELPTRIQAWMPRLAREGVVGADALFACLGPALELFSRFAQVEKVSGEVVTLGEYLEHVWAAVAREALSSIFEGVETGGLEADARVTAMWLWTIQGSHPEHTPDVEDADASTEDDEDADADGRYTLEFDAARKIAQGLGARLDQLESLIAVSGATARLLNVIERRVSLFAEGDARGWQSASGLVRWRPDGARNHRRAIARARHHYPRSASSGDAPVRQRPGGYAQTIPRRRCGWTTAALLAPCAIVLVALSDGIR
jgi:hypothetical protein